MFQNDRQVFYIIKLEMVEQVQCTGEISSTIAAIILGIINSVSGLAAVIGNLIVLITVIKNQSLRQPCYYLLASLSAIDLFVGIAVNPLYIMLTNFVSWQYREEHLLQPESFFVMSSAMIIMHTLSVMGIERYIAVIYPLRYYSVVTVKRSCIAVVIIWVFGFTFSSFSFALTNEDLPKLWITSWMLTGFVPMLVIFFCYGNIFQAARHQSRRIALEQRSVRWAISRDEDGAVTKVETAHFIEAKKTMKTAWKVAIVVVVEVVVSIPVSVINILQISTTDLCRHRHYTRAWMWAAALSFTSSAVDPWIYAMRIRDFKASFKRTLCSK